jgi:hypothetical protein
MKIYYNTDEKGNITEWSQSNNENCYKFETDDDIVFFKNKIFLYSKLSKKEKAEYEEYLNQKNKEKRKKEIIFLLKELDEKRIRAICEPSIKDETSGETWLDYYNLQVQNLREELSNLQ